MNKLSRKDLLLVSLMLFSLFFGAGNLIFSTVFLDKVQEQRCGFQC